MATFKRFEELPAWNAATDLAVAVFKLTEAPSFRFKGDLVNQLRRAALSVANNIAGQRHLNDASRAAYEQKKKDDEFRERFAAYRAKMEEMLRDGTWAKPGVEQPQLFPVPSAQAEKPSAPDAPPACPACGQPMVKRKSRDGAEFWGCSAYPACKGHRSIR